MDWNCSSCILHNTDECPEPKLMKDWELCPDWRCEDYAR